MKNTLRMTASFLGIYAGLLGMQHGIFETLQGPRDPGGVMIQAIGAPCQPEMVWHACYPAMTLIPNLLISGIVAIIMGLMLMIWSAAFIQRRNGGWLLTLLSVGMLLVGGGFVPVLIGVIAGLAGSHLHKPAQPLPAGAKFLAKLWPWTLLLMTAWFPGSWLLGHYFSQEMLATSGFLFLLFDIVLPIVVVFSGYTRQTL